MTRTGSGRGGGFGQAYVRELARRSGPPHTQLACGGFAMLMVIALLGGCGKAGAPIPPEDLGVAVKLEQERQQATREEQAATAVQDPRPVEQKGAQAIEQGTLELPPLRPIGTR